jgi:hypothetical protein
MRSGQSRRSAVAFQTWHLECRLYEATKTSGALQRSAIPIHPVREDPKYYGGMKSKTKWSITLPHEELQLVHRLKKRLGAKTKGEVIRRGLYLLRDTTEREAMRQAYARAASDVRPSTLAALEELDGSSFEGLES